ncbi:MAG: LysR substrate-binding domain-containing protein, partial [Gammaproteobacteria bacterium]|nr:LysR substrate-binding domain-containing protein [Gammaproteobacteria bacterium]
LADQPCILPEHLRTQTLITYPVSPQRLDVFTRFLNPAGVVPAQVRTAEMTLMMAQLVASHRGVAVLPNWAVSEYEASGLLTSRPLGTGGVWGQLYAAVRKRERDAPFMRAFLETLEDVSFRTLRGIRSASSREDIPGDLLRPSSSPGDDEGGRNGQGGT